MPSAFADIGRELIWLDPRVAGLAIALFIAALALVVYLYLRNRRTGLVWRVQAAVISALISGTAAVPFLYFLSTCIVGYCSL